MPVWAESAWAVAPWPMQLHARMSQLAAQCLSGEGFVLLVLQSSHLPVTYMARDTHRAGGRAPTCEKWSLIMRYVCECVDRPHNPHAAHAHVRIFSSARTHKVCLLQNVTTY